MSAAEVFAGGGEMGERMRALDWSKTPLGAVEGWPQSLCSAVSICIGSRFPIVLYWGPQRVVLYNDAYAEILGAKHPWALSRPCREVWSEIWGVIAPMLDGVAAGGQATWSEDQLLVLERRGYPEECYFSFSFSPVVGEDGEVEGIFTAVIENTGRVLGERRLALLTELAARNAAARTAREACVIAIETLAANPQDVPFAIAYLGEARQTATPGADAALAGAQPQHVKELPLPGGRLVLGANPRRPFDEQQAGFLDLVAAQVSTAITSAQAYEQERRRAEALVELDHAKTAFFSNVSHEFRTPLTLMLGPLEELLAGAAGALAPGQRAQLEVAQRNGQRLLKLVNTLLDFARIEAGRASARFEPTDLGRFSADLASNFRSACERAGLSLEVDCPAGLAPARIDREMWEKIVLNLLSNAFKFTFEGGIRVALREEGPALALTVADSGTGIPAQALPHLFERFYRVEDARGRSHEGSGIGLALVQELVRLHGGAIEVASTPGKGTAFTVRLPALAEAPPQADPSAAPVPGATRADAYVSEALSWLPAAGREAPAPAAGQRVLLADDNADLRAYVRRLLAEHYEVEAVGDGEAALAAARARRPDIVVADVMMPKLDGFGLIRELRADPALASLPIVLLSARAGEEARLEGLQKGADAYLAKPFGARQLLVSVGSLLHSAETRREAERRKDEFLATLSHELRNPLAPIRNAVSLLRDARGDGALAAQALDILERQVGHVVRLVDDLLDVARITRGTILLEKRPVTLQAMIETALEISRPHLERARHRVEVALPPEPVAMHADPVRVAQVVANLLNNAAKFTPPGGRISLGARRDGEAALITVADDGRGIAPAALGGLFEMFAAPDGAHPREGGGLGIGLPLSRKLAELHGGTIEAKSDGPGRGAEFVVRLPLGDEARVAQVGDQHVAGRVGDAQGRPRFEHH